MSQSHFVTFSAVATKTVLAQTLQYPVERNVDQVVNELNNYAESAPSADIYPFIVYNLGITLYLTTTN